MGAIELRTAGPADADAVDDHHHRCSARPRGMLRAGGHADLELQARVEKVAGIAFYGSQG